MARHRGSSVDADTPKRHATTRPIHRHAAEPRTMSDLTDLIDRDAILPALKANSKKKLLQDLSGPAGRRTGVPERRIFETILQRERLGSTGVGNGIAIPHGKIAGVERLVGAFARLENPVDFDAIDGAPVDLVFLLLAPENAGAEHLKALSRIARTLRDPDRVARLRATANPDALLAVLADPGRHQAA